MARAPDFHCEFQMGTPRACRESRMPYEPFYERFPEVAEKETRTITIFNDPELPAGEYGLIEAYCNEPDCDCRRVFLNVCSWQRGERIAVIAYGW